MPIESHPRLHEVQEAFARWRRECPRGHTPQELRAQAVSLLSHYRISEVMKALKLDHRRLRRWRRECSSTPAVPARGEFVELLPVAEPLGAEAPPAETALVLTLTRHEVEGHTVSLSGALSAAQWRWALALLRERA